MGLEKPVISGGSIVTPFNFTQKGKVVTSSFYSFNGYGNTNVNPLSLTVDFTASKEKFYMIKESNVIAFGSTSDSDSTTLNFHVKNIVGQNINVSFNNCTVYECEY